MQHVGPYRLGPCLGRGATGSVWRAERPGPVPQAVAIKRARGTARRADAAERLRREARVLAALDHPHIVRVLDVIDEGDEVAVVMPLARGGSLHDLLVERGRLAPGATVAVVARLADALASAHRDGVVHGDVKPANVVFTADGEPLLGDFGVAQVLLGDGPHGPLEGTPGFVDPARVAGGPPRPTNDVYALCVVAHLCLTGRLPDHGVPIRDDPALPVALADLVARGLDGDARRRPTGAAHLAGALRASVPLAEQVLPGTAVGSCGPGAATGEGGGTGRAGDPLRPETRPFGPRPPTPSPAPPGHRLRWVAAAAVVLLALGGISAVPRRVGGGGASRPVVRAAPAAPSTSRPRCPSIEPLPPLRGAEELEVDLRGDGCPVPARWDGAVLHVRVAPGGSVRRYAIRGPGDPGPPGQLLVGDWDCDGTDSPAVYRPGAGVVAYFATVPARVGATLAAVDEVVAARGGRARVVPASGGGCDAVVVT